jgi:hypothetical protein
MAKVTVSSSTLGRREFLGLGAASLATMVTRPVAWGQATQPPTVTRPRATSGDNAVEPDWSERLTVTVGTKDADIVGTGHRAIQAAVDYVARFGGGTVKILPGEYRLRNAVHLASKVRVVGSGADTVLTKEPCTVTKLAEDSDWYDQEVTLVDDRGFQVGDGVCLRTRNPHHGGSDVLKRTLVARRGKRFKLDRPLRENFWLAGESTAATLFPLLSGDGISDFAIADLVLDGNRANNELLDGNYAGCIFLQDCSRAALRGVVARNYHGDGISWQICHDVVVEACHSFGHSGLGLHPGSGSQRPVMRNNRCEANDIGLFFCWGVKFGLAEANRLVGNRVGISIGHRDTDNLICDNVIESSRAVGILFRPERGPTFCAHRNQILANRVTDSGPDCGVAIDVQGGTESVQLKANVLRETRGPAQRVGIRLGKDTKDITLAANQIEGFSQAIEDRRA